MNVNLDALLALLLGGGLTVVVTNIRNFTTWIRSSRIENQTTEKSRRLEAEQDADKWREALDNERDDHFATQRWAARLEAQLIKAHIDPVPRETRKELEG